MNNKRSWPIRAMFTFCSISGSLMLMALTLGLSLIACPILLMALSCYLGATIREVIRNKYLHEHSSLQKRYRLSESLVFESGLPVLLVPVLFLPLSLAATLMVSMFLLSLFSISIALMTKQTLQKMGRANRLISAKKHVAVDEQKEALQ